ncbi:MAG: glycosyltransferase family 2 protein [Heteroscytonema crispum UTEX LB 1556]
MDSLLPEEINQPKVSVLLPNLNNRCFLEERFQTILNQTFADWELVVVDSYSDDGAWELIQEFAKKDSRIRIYQFPREGVYAALNNCIPLARGEYIYIATSDDTMTPDCLEKMVAALDAHTNCDLCHCCLTVIDEFGKEINNNWNAWDKVKFFGDRIKQEHIRLAPHDGILYCALGTVYTSLTELMIRKSVFEKVGLFKTEFGSQGDFEWGLRTSLVCNTVHIPYYLATWRIHSGQVTQNAFIFSSAGQQLWCEMIESAINSLKLKQYILPGELDAKKLTFYYRFQQLSIGLGENKIFFKKIFFILQFLGIRSDVVFNYIARRFMKKEFYPAVFARKILRQSNFDKNIYT